MIASLDEKEGSAKFPSRPEDGDAVMIGLSYLAYVSDQSDAVACPRTSEQGS